MKRTELINNYIDFFKEKGHKEIKNSSLIPENDPTVLFTTAGMQPLIPFLLGQKHPQGKKLVGIQRCLRTKDIEKVGDTYHHTMFEMIGNWSLGDYWKKEAIEMTFEFLTKKLNIPVEKLAATCFRGDKRTGKDIESEKVLLSLGIPKEKIAFLVKDNFWGPAGETGPCGPNTEIFYWKPKDISVPEKFDPEDERWVELGNNVLMEFNKNKEGKYEPLDKKNIDFGGGLERFVCALNNSTDNYEADMWKPVIQQIEKLSNKKYEDNKKEMRIIADHIKAACFIINDGITPSNTEQGYVLRRLIRRAIRFGKKIEIEKFTKKIAEPIFKIYKDYNLNKEIILEELEKEEKKFNKTLEKGLKIFNKMSKNKKIDGKTAFLLFQSYGFPIEITQELAKEKRIAINLEEYQRELEKHQELSRTATIGKFKSGLADNCEATTRLHTAAHLLLQAIKEILKKTEITQKGSNINAERLRFDFTFDRKLTEEEKQNIENLVNKKIKEAIPIIREEMPLEEAKKRGACGTFEDKYGDKVSVYTIGNFSKEICTGPHVNNTKELGKFKIIKEESSSSGVRRIKAILN